MVRKENLVVFKSSNISETEMVYAAAAIGNEIFYYGGVNCYYINL